jgi:hypothetical protein
MSKASKKHAKPAPAIVENVTLQTAAPQQVTTFTVAPPKRPLTGLKFGEKGNAYTHAKLAEAAAQHGGVLTAAQAMEVCVAAQHKGFYSYAVNRLKVLQPIAAQQAPA